jgi:ectoine hydroxylase-related dioxygenase (phytanoyl-CoA dioxygenase family)
VAGHGLAPTLIALGVEQRQHFDQHGWLVVRSAFSPDRVAELSRALDTVVPPAYYARGLEGRVLELPGVSRGSGTLRSHACDPAVGRLAADALAVARVRLLQDSVLIKAARNAARVEWHQDFTYLGFLEPPRIVTVRLALTTCSLKSGCMRVLDGSHRWGLIGGVRALQAASVESALELLPARLRERAARCEIALELGPGDVTLHHCLTFHASGDNASDEPRKTLLVRLCDADCRVEPGRLPPDAAARFPTDDAGCLAGDDFPVIYP